FHSLCTDSMPIHVHPLRVLVFFFYCYGDLRDLHSFPTRRSSDLARQRWASGARVDQDGEIARRPGPPTERTRPRRMRQGSSRCRSEEHTSELQSRRELVCRLLLEKKKPRMEPERPRRAGQSAAGP